VERDDARLVRITRGPSLGSSKRQTSTAAWTLEVAGRERGGTASAGASTEVSSPEEEEDVRWRVRRTRRREGEDEDEGGKEGIMAMWVEAKRRVRRGLMAAAAMYCREYGDVWSLDFGGVAAVPKDCDLQLATSLGEGQ
jgi:hypothetical protein